MKFRLNNKYFRWGLTAFLVIAASIVFYYFMFHRSNIVAGLRAFTDIVMPIVFGFATAYLMTPVLNYIECRFLIPICDKCKIRPSKRRRSIVRGLGILLTDFLLIELVYILIYMVVSQLMPSIQNIVKNFNHYINNFTTWTDRMLKDNPEVGDFVQRIIDQYSGQLDDFMRELPSNFSDITNGLRTVTNTATNILGVLWDFIIGFIISIYVMASKEKFAGQAKKIAYALFERDTANLVIRNFRFTHQTFIGFLGGKLLDSFIIGLLCFMGTTLLKTPYAALVSVIIGVTNVIPFFGPYLGAIPSAILILIVNPMHPQDCIYFLIFILVLQQFDGNILGPKILGNSTGLTSFWVIFAITLFGGLFGVIGMIIGVPIFAVIYAAIKSVINTMLQKKDLPIATKPYETLDYMDEDGFHDRQPEAPAKSQIQLPVKKKTPKKSQADTAATNEKNTKRPEKPSEGSAPAPQATKKDSVSGGEDDTE